MPKEVALLLLLALLLESSLQVHGECRLTNDYIEKSLSTFTYRDDHGKLQIQRFASIEEGKILELYCQSEHKVSVKHIGCRRGVLKPHDPQVCDQTIHAKVLVTDADHFCLATMYRIGIEVEKQFFELYRACYDAKNVQSYFSDAIIYWKPIHPKSPRPRFATDSLITPRQEASFQAKNIYNTFKKIYGDAQNYIKRDNTGKAELVINRGHLTAAGDMTFADQMISTFKYLNVVPQFKSINDGNWLKIEHWVGDNIPKNSVLHVRTGALGVLSLLDFKPKRTLHPAYLIPERKQNPVPEWTYKIIRNADNHLLHVFLTYNNIFNPVKPTAHRCCTVVPCPVKLPDSAALGFSYCCKPDEFVKCLPTRK